MIEEPIVDVTCSNCGQHGHVVRFRRPSDVMVRGITVNVVKTLRRCDACTAEFENSADYDWRLDAYAAYRAHKGYVTPTQIVEWRSKTCMTDKAMARQLGLDHITLARYEQGSLQSADHNRKLTELINS